MKKTPGKSQEESREDLLAKVEALESRLAEAEETLRAIRSGEVDALVVSTREGDQVFTLTSAEQPYRTMVEAMNEGAVTLFPDGTVLYCNRRFAEMVKAPLESIISRSVLNFIKPGQEAFFKAFIRRISKCDRMEMSLAAADGTPVPVLFSMSDLCGGVPGSICLLATDLTELRAMQYALEESLNELEIRVKERTRELAESEERFRTIAETLPVLVSITRTTDATILFTNAAYNEAFGFRKGELVGRKGPDLYFDPADRAKMIAAIEKQGFVRNYQVQVQKCDGTPLWLSSSVLPMIYGGEPAIIGASIDITDQKRAEDALRESKQQLDLALLSAQMGVWCWDIATQKRYFDDQVCRLLGIDSRKFAGTKEDFLAAVHPDDLAAIKAAQAKTIEQDAPYEAEYRAVWPDGSIHYINSRGMLVRDEAERPARVNGLLWDVTESRKAETLLKDRSQQLEEANRELESFSYSVSHDLRAPLRAIDGYARIILKKQGDRFDTDTLRKFNEIRLNTQRMDQLIEDLLTFSRLGRKQMSLKEIDMEQLVRDIWKEMEGENPDRKVALTLCGMTPGYGDRALIRQVFFNLLANAFKFTKPRPEAAIAVGGEVAGHEAVYYVRDNGVGFDMQYCDKLFGVFQRLHATEDFEGTGVGLATVQRIIHRHGGRVWAEGKVDEGATFYFSMPLPHNPP